VGVAHERRQPDRGQVRQIHDDEQVSGCGERRELQIDLLRPFHVETARERDPSDVVGQVLVCAESLKKS
jgi:hypothetical protein